MNFVSNDVAMEFALVPNELLQWTKKLETYMNQCGLGPLVITDVGRKPEWYTLNGLSVPDWSWHFVESAIDIRTKHLLKRPDEKKQLEAWCQGNIDSRFECKVQDHGTGPHIHIGFKSWSRYSKWKKEHPK